MQYKFNCGYKDSAGKVLIGGIFIFITEKSLCTTASADFTLTFNFTGF